MHRKPGGVQPIETDWKHYYADCLGYRDVFVQTLSDICDQADDKLFERKTLNDRHLLYSPFRQ